MVLSLEWTHVPTPWAGLKANNRLTIEGATGLALSGGVFTQPSRLRPGHISRQSRSDKSQKADSGISTPHKKAICSQNITPKLWSEGKGSGEKPNLVTSMNTKQQINPRSLARFSPLHFHLLTFIKDILTLGKRLRKQCHRRWRINAWRANALRSWICSLPFFCQFFSFEVQLREVCKTKSTLIRQ